MGKEDAMGVCVTSFNYGTVTCNRCHKPISLDDYAITEKWISENQYCRHCGQRLFRENK